MAPKKKAASAASATAVGDVDAEQQQQHNGSEQQAMTSPTATTTAAVTSPESGNNNNNTAAVTASTASTTPPPPAASTSAVTTFARLQQALAADAEAINQHVGDVLELMQAAEGSSGNSTAATTAAAPLLLRLRALEFIASHVGHLHDTAALKRIVTSVVRILSADEDTTPLLVAATQCLAGLGAIAVHDKSCEYLAREGADVLMQVMLDTDAFAEPVRVAAGKALDALTASALRPVVTKLLHWLSDAREEDTAEQLTRERRLALARLTKLTMSPLAASLWTGETQQFVLSLLPRILASVDAHEYAQLLRVVAHLPLVAAQHGAPLLQCVLQDVATGKPDSDRALEALSLAARFVSLPPATTTATTAAAAATTAATTTAVTPAAVDGNEEEQPQHVSTATTSEADKKSSDDGGSAATAALTAAAAELMATLNKAQLLTTAVAGDGARGVHHARVVLLACRLASVLPADAVEQLTTYTLAQLQSLLCSSNSSSSASQQQQTQAVEATNDDEEGADAAAAAAAAAVPLHERNTSTIESLLFAIVALVRARPVEMRQRLQSTQLRHCLTALTRCAADTLSLARYAVTKLSQRAAEAATTAAAAAAAADGAAQTEKASDYAELLTSLHNIHALAEALASSRLPLSELRPSWFGGNNSNAAAARRAHALHKHGNSNSHEVAMRLLPPQPGTRAAAAAAHGGGGGARRKRSRSPSRHGDRDGRNAAQRSRSGRNSATLAAARRRRH